MLTEREYLFSDHPSGPWGRDTAADESMPPPDVLAAAAATFASCAPMFLAPAPARGARARRVR